MVGAESAQHDRADCPCGIYGTVLVHTCPTYSTLDGRDAVRSLHGSHLGGLRFQLEKSHHPEHRLRSLAHLHHRQRHRHLHWHHPRVSKLQPVANLIKANGADGVSHPGL